MTKPRLRWLAAFTTLALVASACADDDDDDAGDEPADSGDFEAISYDESDQCGTEEYTGNLAMLEAVDELTVRFTLCEPDAAFPAKVAFSALGIHSSDYLEETGGGGDLITDPMGTGPYQLEAWDQGNEIVLTAYEDYWGDPASIPTVVFRWGEESAQRLLALQAGDVDGIDNVGAEDFPTVEEDGNLQLLPRDLMNVLYLGFNVDLPPLDNELLRQAVGYAINRERLVDNYYPEGSEIADQFLASGMPFYEDGPETYTYDQDRARDLLEQAGYPDGVDLGALSYRNVARPYLEQPVQVASDIRDQLAQVGITVTLDEQESGAFIDNANAGNLGLHLLGWNADFPDPTNFWDFHFGQGATPQFGTGFEDLHEVLAEGGATIEDDARADLYSQANELLMEHAPALPLVYGASGVAFDATVEEAHASPLSNEQFVVMSSEDDQLVWMQNGEPSGLYCADETDGEALRVCEQINESLLGYEAGGSDVVPSLAEDMPENNEESTEFTFTLREGVTFHDGSSLDANDVVQSYRVQWDAADPLHVGRQGDFNYFRSLLGGFLNPPPEAGG